MLFTSYHAPYKLPKMNDELLLVNWREYGSIGHFMHIWKQHLLKKPLWELIGEAVHKIRKKHQKGSLFLQMGSSIHSL